MIRNIGSIKVDSAFMPPSCWFAYMKQVIPIKRGIINRTLAFLESCK